MHRDVLIVGFGLAGWALTEALTKEGKSFVVFDPFVESSSRIATGIYNPVVLKRFRAIYHVDELMAHSVPFYKHPKYASALNPMPIWRVFASESEQNDWAVASDNSTLRTYLGASVSHLKNDNILAPSGMGEVLHTGWVNTSLLLHQAHKHLLQKQAFVSELFSYKDLIITSKGVEYGQWKATHIIFAEGVGIRKNPWFSNLPVVPNKGEWLIVKCPGLHLKYMLKGSVFIVPLGGDRYRVGATYAHSFSSLTPTNESKGWLMECFKKYIALPFEVESHGTGVRPTVPDRKPLVGKHPKYPALNCVNGLGSRGILWAPFLASSLINCLFNKQDIPVEVDLTRYFKV
ncbi:MAG: FAD-dependent oxidoreductase [Flavobacteriaceae bacterium]|nr:FAD-dependent oxidoreductase [Flavobacteriaceae bacterium]